MIVCSQIRQAELSQSTLRLFFIRATGFHVDKQDKQAHTTLTQLIDFYKSTDIIYVSW